MQWIQKEGENAYKLPASVADKIRPPRVGATCITLWLLAKCDSPNSSDVSTCTHACDDDKSTQNVVTIPGSCKSRNLLRSQHHRHSGNFLHALSW